MGPETQAFHYRQLLGVENGQNCIVPSNRSCARQGALSNTCKRRQSQHNSGGSARASASACLDVQDSLFRSGTLGGEIVDAYCLEICRAVEDGKHDQLRRKILELAHRVACGIHKRASCATLLRFQRYVDDSVIPHLFRLKYETNAGPFSLQQPSIPSQHWTWPAPHATQFDLGAYQSLAGPETAAYIPGISNIMNFPAEYTSDSIQGSPEDSHIVDNVLNQPELSPLGTIPRMLLSTSSTAHTHVLSDWPRKHCSGYLPAEPNLYNNINFLAETIDSGRIGSSNHCADTNHQTATSEVSWGFALS